MVIHFFPYRTRCSACACFLNSHCWAYVQFRRTAAQVILLLQTSVVCAAGLTSRRPDLVVVLASRSFHCTFIPLALLVARRRVLASRRADFVVVLAGRSHHLTYCLLWLWLWP